MYMFTPQDIRELRRALGLTVAEFAAKVGVDRDAVYLWEQGKRHPRYDTLVALNRLAREAGFSLTA